jgi:hypothetical protein
MKVVRMSIKEWAQSIKTAKEQHIEEMKKKGVKCNCFFCTGEGSPKWTGD